MVAAVDPKAESANGAVRGRKAAPSFSAYVVQSVEADGTTSNATRSSVKDAYALFGEKMGDNSLLSVVLLQVTRTRVLMQRNGPIPND